MIKKKQIKDLVELLLTNPDFLSPDDFLNIFPEAKSRYETRKTQHLALLDQQDKIKELAMEMYYEATDDANARIHFEVLPGAVYQKWLDLAELELNKGKYNG